MQPLGIRVRLEVIWKGIKTLYYICLDFKKDFSYVINKVFDEEVLKVIVLRNHFLFYFVSNIFTIKVSRKSVID